MPETVKFSGELRGFRPQISTSDVRRHRRAGPRHPDTQKRGRAKSPGPRLPFCRAARDRENLDGAHPGQGAQLHPRADSDAVRRMRQLPGDRRRKQSRRHRDRRREQQRRSRRCASCATTSVTRRRRGNSKSTSSTRCTCSTKAAFNALLKTLEEPPEHVKFMSATTEPEKVPTTILIPLPAVRSAPHPSESDCAASAIDRRRRRRLTLSRRAAHAIARGAEGGMRDAESMLDQLVAFCGEKIAESRRPQGFRIHQPTDGCGFCRENFTGLNRGRAGVVAQAM